MTAVAEQSAATAALRTRSLTTLPRVLFAAVIDCLHLFDCIVDRDAFAACHLSIARIGAPSLFSWRIFVTRSRRTRSRSASRLRSAVFSEREARGEQVLPVHRHEVCLVARNPVEVREPLFALHAEGCRERVCETEIVARHARTRGIRVETGRPWVEEEFAALLGAGSCECGIDLCYSRQTPACSWVKNAETKVAAGLGRAEAR